MLRKRLGGFCPALVSGRRVSPPLFFFFLFVFLSVLLIFTICDLHPPPPLTPVGRSMRWDHVSTFLMLSSSSVSHTVQSIIQFTAFVPSHCCHVVPRHSLVV